MPARNNAELIEEMRWQLRKVTDRKAANERLLDGLGRADAELDSMRATRTSPDGTVTVTAGPGGLVDEVRLTESAMRADAATLSRTITGTVREAMAEAAQRQVSLVRAHTGEELTEVDVLGPQARFLAAPAAATPAPPVYDEDEPVDIFDDDEDDEPAPPPVHEDSPVSESDAFLRGLGIGDDHR